MAIPGLDDVDNRIIEILRKNARMSYSDIGHAIGKSRVAVKARIEQLEEKGIIRGYCALIDTSAVPGGIQFTLDIETHAVGVAPNSETLGTYARHLHRSTDGVRKLSWQVLVTTYKDTERGVEYEVRHQEHEHLEGNSGEKGKQKQGW